MTPLFKISKLTARYGRASNVLRGIDADILKGKFTVIIGPNGSGKSTLLRVIAGLQTYNGSVTLDGQEVRGFSRRQYARMVGVVPQDFRPAYPFPVWEVISMGRLPHRSIFAGSEIDSDKRVLESATRVDVSHLLQRDVTTLSGGEAQRVLLACVLAQDPPVMLLDEPTSALDPNQAARVLTLLRNLVHEEQNKRTVIAVMHDVNIALAFADYYIALRDGLLCSSGPIAKLDGYVLKELYGTSFTPYKSQGGDVMWRACAE